MSHWLLSQVLCQLCIGSSAALLHVCTALMAAPAVTCLTQLVALSHVKEVDAVGATLMKGWVSCMLWRVALDVEDGRPWLVAESLDTLQLLVLAHAADQCVAAAALRVLGERVQRGTMPSVPAITCRHIPKP
jgi:uncharacterized YccA/Bax inhibitor family protein